MLGAKMVLVLNKYNILRDFFVILVLYCIVIVCNVSSIHVEAQNKSEGSKPNNLI